MSVSEFVTCIICNETKPFKTGFSQSKKGSKKICLACGAAKMRAYRATEAGKLAMAETNKKYRLNNRETALQCQKNWYNAHPEKGREYALIYKKRHRNKYNARNIARRIPVEPCSICGSMDNVERHHHDYSKPRDVTFLCRKHHRELHLQNPTGEKNV